MNKILTAEELLKEKLGSINWMMEKDIELVVEAMNEHTTSHVKAALEAAAKSRVNMGMNEPFTADEQYEILNAYPLENIK